MLLKRHKLSQNYNRLFISQYKLLTIPKQAGGLLITFSLELDLMTELLANLKTTQEDNATDF